MAQNREKRSRWKFLSVLRKKHDFFEHAICQRRKIYSGLKHQKYPGYQHKQIVIERGVFLSEKNSTQSIAHRGSSGKQQKSSHTQYIVSTISQPEVVLLNLLCKKHNPMDLSRVLQTHLFFYKKVHVS